MVDLAKCKLAKPRAIRYSVIGQLDCLKCIRVNKTLIYCHVSKSAPTSGDHKLQSGSKNSTAISQCIVLSITWRVILLKVIPVQ